MQSESNEPDINQAWHQKRYDVILSLIKEDSDFPENFATTDLDENVEDQCNLLRFVEERRSFHRSIEEGDLENVKTFPFNEGSALYLNEVNHSALYTAVVNKRFEIYAFLRSVGADFRNDEERNAFDELTGPEKNSLTDALVPYFFQSSKAHIYYLISKSRAQKPVNNLEGIVRDYYEKLEQIPEVSIIFKIIHYADFLDIVFDFDNDNVAYLSATASKETKGDTNYKAGRIFIAAGRNRKPNEILGTIAHELTHMAMQIIYENDCDPYYKSEALGFEKVRDFCKKFSNSHEPISKVLSETFSSYGIKDYDSELIARVPHILAQFSDNNTGETWLTEEGTDLWNYFKEKVIVDCEKFIKESSVIKSKNQIRLLNESVGEIKRVENCQLFFNDVTQIQNRLETRKSNVFLFGGKSTWLTALKALQALYGKTYLNKYDSFLVVKFEICKKQPLRIMQECYKEGCDVLIIENIGNLVNQSHFECLDLISELLQKPNKRVVFTVKEEEMLGVEKELKEMNLSVFCFSDRSPTLLDLDDESQRKILDQAVYFQGKRIFLKNLLKGNHELKDIIDFDVIEKITKSEKIEIGSKWSGMASVDGAYGEVLEEINAESFMEEVEMSNKIFLIDGLKEADRVEELLSCVQRKLESETSERKNSNLEKLRDILNNYSKRIVFVENFVEKQFKEFCEENANREIYWVKTNKSLLILQSLYNINFYLGRTFAFYSKLIISKEALIERLKQCTILISHSDRDSFVDLFEFHGYEKRENFMKTIDSSNVRFFESDEIAEIEYESLIENVDSESKPIYWLKKEEDQLIWKNCNAPFQDVKNCIDRNASQKSSATERDLLEKIIHDQVFIIADDPGMGKTTTLTKLCETKFNSQAMMNSHWIIKISFQDQLQAIRNIDVENLCINEIITLISETNANLKTNFAKNLLRCAMDPKYKGIKPLLLTFDGFDQLIEDEDRSIVISLLKFLRKETRSKIWITTRLQFKEILENNLFTFATDFEPIEDSGKEEFITKFFKNRLKLISSPKRMTEIFESVQGSETLPEIAHYAKNFIKHMHGIFQQNVGRFIGTPLQLYLMLENSLEYFTKNYARGNFSILGGNMLQIYKNFINKKYKMYYKKIQSEGLTFTLDEVKEHCNSCHKQWAKVLIFELDSAKFLNKIKNRPTVISCGIIKYQGGFLEFMHPTFGEYYSSKIFFSWMTNAKNFLSHKSKIEYLLENIFVRPAYQLVRNFLNFRLKKINIKLVPKKNLKQFGTVMSNVLKKRDKKITFMDVIMKEEQLGILDFVDAALKQNDENIWDFISHLGDPILIYACSLNATNVIQYLLDKIETMTKSEQYRILSTRGSSLETCLHQAAMCNNLIVVGLILERVEQISSQDQLYEFLSLKDSDNYTSLISGFAFVGKIIVDNAYGSSKETRGISFSTMPLILSDKPYFVAQKMFSTYLEFCLFDKNTAGSRAESFLSLFMNKNHDKNTMEVVKSILKKIPRDKIYDFISQINVQQINALHLASVRGYYDLVRLLFFKLQEAASGYENKKELANQQICQLIMSKRCCGINALQMAAICGHEKLFALLLAEIPPEKKFEAICFNDKLQYGETMQKVITRGYTEVAELVLNELETVSTTEQMNTFLFLKYDNGDTSLHVAAEKGYLQIARKLLELAEDPFELMMSTGRYNDSALLRSVNFDQIKMAEVLIQTISKEKIYSTFCVLAADGSNIFHASVSSKNFDFIKLIGEKVKDAGMHPEEMREFLLKKNRQGNNVLHIAAEKSNLEVTTYLLEYMSNVIEQTQYDLIVVQGADKHTVIHRAVFSGQTEVVEYLIDIVPDQKIRFVYDLLDEGTRNIFHLAAMRDNSRFVKLILEKLDKEFSGEERREFFYLKTGQGNNAFHLASEKGNVAVMKYLLKYAKTISAESEYSLIMAKDGTGSSVLQRAVLFARSDIAQFLMRFVPKDKMKSIFQDLDNFENSILHASVTTWQEDCDLLNWLLRILSNELSIEQIRKCFHLKNKDGNTALHLAAEYNSSTVMKCLLKYAASIYENQSIYDFIMLEGEDDCSVIEKAVSLGSVETVECLLGMIPNEKKYTVYLNADANGYNIFHRAIHRMDEAIIYLFTRKLETEFSVEQKREIFFSKTIEGNNVLHLAALKIDNTIMNNLFGFAVRISGRSGYELLLEKNLEGNTVLHCTALNSSSAMIENMFRKIPIEKIYSTFLIKNNKGYNILHFAALQEDSSILKVLLQKLDSSLSSEEMRELLLLPSDAKHNVLHIAAGGKKDKSNCLMECATKISSLAPIDFITVKDVYGHSALCRAVRFGSLEVSEFLLNKIPKEKICSVLTEVDQIGMNLLHHAACRQDCDFVHLILNKIKVTITEEQLKKFFYLKTNEGFTALAVMHSLAVTEYLFKFGTDILKEDAFTLITTPGPSDTPLIHTAVGLGLVEHVSFFLDNVTEKQMYNSFCSTNSDGRSLLHFTVLQENLPFIQMILEKLESVLPTAEERLNYFFLRANDGDSVLSLAAGNTSLEAMKFLLDYAANISKRHVCDLVIPNDAGNNSMIHEAMVSGKFEVAEYLINMTSKEKVYSIFLLKDLAGRNVLHCAAHRKNLKFIQLVTKKLEESVPMEVIKTAFLLTTNSDDNVLHIAAIQDDSSVAKYLLNYALTVLNLDVYHLLTVTGSENMSVIHKAAAFGNTDLAKDIIETIPKQKLHSILSLTDDNGYNILHHSALKGDCALLELIIIKLQATWPVEQIKDYIFSKAKNGKNPLHIAAGKNHASVLKSLLEFACIIFVEDPENLILKIMGLPLDKIHQDVLYPIICQAIDKNGCNMLHTAILKKDITLITWILEHALPNERLREYLFQETKKRFTAFQMAATKSSKTVLKYLLHYAANKLDEDLYDLIISKTAGYDGCAIIQLAVAFASIEVVEYLLDIIPQEKMYSTFRFVTNNNEVSILQYGAAVSKKWDILDLVLKKLKSSSLSTEEIKQLFLMKCKDGFNIFHAAVENLDDPSIIENLNKYATETLNLNTCDLILEKSIEGYTSIKTAVCRGRIEVLDYVLSIIPHEKLFEAFSSSDKNGENILHEAAVRQDPDFIQLIIKKIEEAMSLKEKQELLSLTSNLKNTAFHRAAAKNVLQVVVFLFEYGARILGKDQFSFITAKNINDYTAIHGALYSGCFEVAEYLINIIPPDKIYSTFRMVEKSGSNFLHLAAFRDDCNFVKLIVDKLEGLGMPNKLVQDFFFLKTKTGENVLHLAAEKSNFTVFKYLLDYAEKISLLSQYELINAKNSKNSSVIFKAVALGHADVAEFVLDTIPEGKLYSCIRESDKLGGNILHFSASNKNSTVIQFLMKKLETKLTPQQVEELFFSGMLKGGCVLHVAAENENSDILKYLLEYAVKISGSTYYDQIILKDVKGNTVLHHASFKGKPDPGRFLLDLIPKEKLYTIVCAPNMDGCNVLLLSVVQNNCALIKLIMEKLKSIVTANQIIKLMRSKARTGQTAFELASEKGYSDIITYLSEIEENL